MDTADQDQARELLDLLDEAILRSRRSRREIERSLGWSQGYLGSLLRGRIGLKVWHVFALSRELEIEPLSFFLRVAPPRDPRWLLEQLGIAPTAPGRPAPAETPPVTRAEVEEMIRRMLREELQRMGVEPAYSR